MKKISVKQKSVKLFAPVRKGSEQRSASEGKAFLSLDHLRWQPATSAISVLGAGAGAAVSGLSGGGGVLAKTGVSAATNVASTVTVNAIQCGGDWDKFADSMKNFYTWKGCISSTAGSLVTNSMNATFLEDGNGIALNGDTFNAGGISSLTSLSGGLASTAVTYGLTGNATLNVASIQGQGIMELSFGKDGFHTRLGTGGTNVSWQTLMSAASGVGEARKVASWKYGGEESCSTLNAINMLGYTGTKDDRSNKDLAKDIWNESINVKFTEFEGNVLGKADENSNLIYINNKLLGGEKEGAAQVASMFSHEGLHIKGKDEMQSRIGGYDTFAQLSEKFNVTGEAYDSISDIAYMSEVYKQYGDVGVFTELFFGDTFSKENLERDYYLAEVVDPRWRQVEAKNKGIKLGLGYTQKQVEEYNKLQKEQAYEKYKEEEYNEFINKDKNKDTEYEDFTPEKTLDSFTDKDVEKYGFNLTTYNDLYNYACTLSTAAYMAYSITGEYSSLKEANDLLIKNNNFTVDESDGQKNLLLRGKGETYVKAINILAKADYDVIEYVGSQSNNRTVEQNKEMEKYLLSLQNDSENEYYVHLRTNSKNNPTNYNYHSVLLSGVEQLNLIGVPSYVKERILTTKVNILDPSGQYSSKSINQISRADAYKLTEYGRVYKGQRNIQVPNKLQYVNYMYSQHNYYKTRFEVKDYGYKTN